MQDHPKPSYFLSHFRSSTQHGSNNSAIRSYRDKACSLLNLEQQCHPHWKSDIYEIDFNLPFTFYDELVPEEGVHLVGVTGE